MNCVLPAIARQAPTVEGGNPGTIEFRSLHFVREGNRGRKGYRGCTANPRGAESHFYTAGHRWLVTPENSGVQPRGRTNTDVSNQFQRRGGGVFCLAGKRRAVREDQEGKTCAELILIESSAGRERGKGTGIGGAE